MHWALTVLDATRVKCCLFFMLGVLFTGCVGRWVCLVTSVMGDGCVGY